MVHVPRAGRPPEALPHASIAGGGASGRRALARRAEQRRSPDRGGSKDRPLRPPLRRPRCSVGLARLRAAPARRARARTPRTSSTSGTSSRTTEGTHPKIMASPVSRPNVLQHLAIGALSTSALSAVTFLTPVLRHRRPLSPTIHAMCSYLPSPAR
jgi:hypothetical protein